MPRGRQDVLNEERASNTAEEIDAGNPRTNAEYRDEAIGRMMEAAIRLIAERGASKLSLVDVGREAGYSHSLPNYYFKSKKQMLLDLYTFIIDGARGRFREWTRVHFPERLRPGLSNVQGTIRGYLWLVQTDLPSTRAMNILASEAICSMPELLEVVQPNNRAFMDFFQYQLRTGIRRGEIDPSIDVEAITLLIVATLRGATAQYMADPRNVNLQKLADTMVDLLNRSIVLPKHDA